jgi:hypothetical protein
MIVFQSSRPIAALSRRPGSPKGCRRLAGGEPPGSPSLYPCALKGRWKRIRFNCSFVLFVPLHFPKLSKAARILPSLSKGRCQGFPWLLPGPSKPIQGVPSHSKPFSEKKDCLFFVRLSSPPSTTTNQSNSNLKSTVAFPKSTIDSDLEKLIWGENGLPAPLLPDLRHSFRSITTWELWDAGQMQTDAGQKFRPPSP